jgi:hypothetical protein
VDRQASTFCRVATMIERTSAMPDAVTAFIVSSPVMARRSFPPSETVVNGLASDSRSGSEETAQARLRHDREDQAGEQGTQVSGRRQDEQAAGAPRARTMPLPNNRPPSAAPDRLCGEAIWRASLVSIKPATDPAPACRTRRR